MTWKISVFYERISNKSVHFLFCFLYLDTLREVCAKQFSCGRKWITSYGRFSRIRCPKQKSLWYHGIRYTRYVNKYHCHNIIIHSTAPVGFYANRFTITCTNYTHSSAGRRVKLYYVIIIIYTLQYRSPVTHTHSVPIYRRDFLLPRKRSYIISRPIELRVYYYATMSFE